MKTDIESKTSQADWDLLLFPENWPQDEKIQRELSELLELHLALQAHRGELRSALQTKNIRFYKNHALALAATALIAFVPAVLAIKKSREMHLLKTRERTVDTIAIQKAQERLWKEFFAQSLTLIKEFQDRPPQCAVEGEDRKQERETAVALLQASHQLSSQGAPLPEAEAIRTKMHAWLTEIALKDDCMSKEAVGEIRQMAAMGKLEDGINRIDSEMRRAHSK